MSTTTVRIDKDVIIKLDMLGRFKESYSQVIDRIATKQLALQSRAAQIEKEALALASKVPMPEPTAKTGYHTPLENMSF